MMRTLFLLPLLLTAGALPALAAPPVTSQLQSAADEVMRANSDIPGISISIFSPTRKIQWTGLSGRERLGGKPLRDPPAFRIASVTKPFVAATVLRLVEQGRLKLTDPIADLAAPETVAQLRADGYDPSEILIRHLLEHTSGIFDYAMAPQFHDRIIADPKHRWSRREQIGLAMSTGKPLGQPGEAMNYSDTGYVILGEIVERVSGMSLPAAVRRLTRFERLGLRSTWFETLEPQPPRAAPKAHQYWVQRDITDWDPSFDLYGGGGLVSTTPELAIFFRALVSGRIFDRPETLAAALATSPGPSHAAGARAHAPLLYTMMVGEEVCWSHGGFFGTLAGYCPASDTAFAIAVNANSAGASKAMRQIVTRMGAILGEAR